MDEGYEWFIHGYITNRNNTSNILVLLLTLLKQRHGEKYLEIIDQGTFFKELKGLPAFHLLFKDQGTKGK